MLRAKQPAQPPADRSTQTQSRQDRVLAHIAQITGELADRDERNLIRGAIQEIMDRRAGKT